MVRLLIGSVGAPSAGLSPIIARFDAGINTNPRSLLRRDVPLAEGNQQWTDKEYPVTDHRTGPSTAGLAGSCASLISSPLPVRTLVSSWGGPPGQLSGVHMLEERLGEEWRAGMEG